MSDGFSRPTFKYAHFAGAISSQTVKSGIGVLRAITIGTTGATVAALTVSDGANTIATITPIASSAPTTIQFDIAFATSLVLNGGGSTMDITVSYQ